VVHVQEGQPTPDATSTRGGRRRRVPAQEECVRVARAVWLDGSAMVARWAWAERGQHLLAAVQHLVIALPASPSRRESSQARLRDRAQLRRALIGLSVPRESTLVWNRGGMLPSAGEGLALRLMVAARA
jgi:hypothetical protein